MNSLMYCSIVAITDFNLLLANALNAIPFGTNDLQSFLESLYSLYSQSPKNMRELSDCDMICISASKRIGKVFTIRWVASSFRAVSAVNTSVRMGGESVPWAPVRP